MGASTFEYRFRYLLHGLVYALGFWSPWLRFFPSWTAQTSWHVLMTSIAHEGIMSFNAAASVLLAVSILLTAGGASLRVWGAAYLGSGIVQSHSMHGNALLADGPYRFIRNPLYLGTLLHTVGVALLMPPSGSIFAIALLWIFQVRLAIAEEPFLTQRFGESYRAYAAAVPRFLPLPRSAVPAAGGKPRWAQAAAGELYMIGVALTFAALGWSFNINWLIKGVLISLGVSLIVRAFVPKPKSVQAPTA